MLELNKIYEIAQGIDEHIGKLTACLDVMKDIRDSIKAIREQEERKSDRELERMRYEIVELTKALHNQGLELPSEYEQEFNRLKNTLFGDEWPEAVPQELICSDEEKVYSRAEDIIEIFIAEHLKGKRFLDFGCGEGHVVVEANKRGADLSYGYDISKTWKFKNQEGMFFTNDFNRISELAPYDIILLYDVIDHVDNPVEVLKQAESVLSREGRIYIKCHPWCSRHGTHLYKQVNRAFLHLLTDEVELTRLGGYNEEKTLKVTNPIVAYKEWFAETKLSVESEIITTTEVENFFRDTVWMWDKIKELWPGEEFPENHMKIDFIDYIVVPEGSDHQIF